MKWRTFALGALAGAFAAGYMSRRQPGLLRRALRAASVAGAVIGEGALLSRRLSEKKGNASAAKGSAAVSADNGAGAWRQISSLLERDRDAMAEAEKIVADAAVHGETRQEAPPH
ncbi:hypothetical protein PACILC2_02890 [Paenibacillus cisolokensis]|uniref:Uncharacterized protein n=1 Tax=Paenibacillus cisolokensis TaxID=1658519 RepID=A0ABQ4N0L3_9BACL|nr:hypothetical protein [Paenibacillus cisolokensis]GIQ61721.1 hypothetical protein PACILC2_02890 [Paenibacillus cisolokensis]